MQYSHYENNLIIFSVFLAAQKTKKGNTGSIHRSFLWNLMLETQWRLLLPTI